MISASVDGLMCIFDTKGDINDDEGMEYVSDISTVWNPHAKFLLLGSFLNSLYLEENYTCVFACILCNARHTD